MTFLARGIVVSLAFCAVLYCLLSLLTLFVWRCLSLWDRTSVHLSANALFGLRIFPLAFSAGISAFLAFPSFLRFESHTMDEDWGTLVGACAFLLLARGLYRVIAAQAATTEVVSRWLAEPHRLQTEATIPVVLGTRNAPPLLLIGVLKPKVLVSEAARNLLTSEELRVAMQHEVEHIRSRDNLKKVILNCAVFPGMAKLERAWQEAAEFAADAAAITNRREALDLASALIKLSRSLPLQAAPALTTGMLSASGTITSRVERLLAPQKAAGIPKPCHSRYAIVLGFIAIGSLALNFGPILAFTHRLTDFFVP